MILLINKQISVIGSEKKADEPRIKRMLKTFEPRIFPRANWSLSLRAATRLVANSGREVPPARIVTAMNLLHFLSHYILKIPLRLL